MSKSSRGELSGQGFTLLEVMIGALVIAMLVLTLNRFVVANLTALKVSREASAERQAMNGFVNLIQAQINALAPNGQNRLLGQPHRFGSDSSDTMEWQAQAGIGVLTTAATGEYRVSLELKPRSQKSSVLELGLRRIPVGGAPADESWVPLMSPVKALEIRYYHAAMNSKVDRWSDGNSLPSLIYLSVQRSGADAPYEAVLTVPAAYLQK